MTSLLHPLDPIKGHDYQGSISWYLHLRPNDQPIIKMFMLNDNDVYVSPWKVKAEPNILSGAIRWFKL